MLIPNLSQGDKTMFKNKKVFSIMLVSALVAALVIGLMAISPPNTVSAAGPDEAGVAQRGGPNSPGGRHGGADNAYLAEALGLTAEELQAAFDEMRAAGEPGDGADKSELLAAALGITVDELEAAHATAREAAIEQAIANGKITAEQAALMEAREALRNYLDQDEILAKALGITVAALETAQEDGKRVPDLLEDLGIDEETFKANMDAAHEDALNQAVAAGVITPEQANQIQAGGFSGPGGPGNNRGPARGGCPNGGTPDGKKPEGSINRRPGGQPPAETGGNG